MRSLSNTGRCNAWKIVKFDVGRRALSQFVPEHQPANEEDVRQLVKLLTGCQRLVVLTGAGISTESGIPDYRSQGVGLYATSTRRPVRYAQFIEDPEARRRYWARNVAGWDRFSKALPNHSHLALAALEAHLDSLGRDVTLVTQNVDGLHSKAGSRRVVELHGSAFAVLCLRCGFREDRAELQKRALDENPHLRGRDSSGHRVAPDGDVHLSHDEAKWFRAPRCPRCEGPIKPDVVFFGENVPRPTVDGVYASVGECDALLVVGSSLQVYSGYRFLVEAHERRKPIAIVNVGPTKADGMALVKVDSSCGCVLPRVVRDVVRVLG